MLVSTQMLNAVLLPLLPLLVRLSRDRLVLGDHVVSRRWVVVEASVVVAVFACVALLLL